MGTLDKFRARGKKIFDRMRNEKVKQNLLQAIPFWLASAVAGLVAVLYAKLFVMAERGTAFILHIHAWLLFAVSPLCFITSWWVVTRWAPYFRGSGIPQIMAALELATPKFDDKVSKLLNLKIIVVGKVFPKNVPEATLNCAKSIMADMIVVNPKTESAASGIADYRHLSDLLQKDSTIQVPDVEPYKKSIYRGQAVGFDWTDEEVDGFWD